MIEQMQAIAAWKAGTLSMHNVQIIIAAWKAGSINALCPGCFPGIEPPPPPPPPTCITEGRWAGLTGICCAGLEKDFWGFCRAPTPPEPVPPEPVPPEPVPPEPVPPPEACPRGPMYTRGLFEVCDPGYIAQRGADQQWWEVPNLCVCAEGLEPPTEDALELSALIPLVLVIGAVLLVLTMVKR